MAEDNQFATALRGKPLSSHRVKAILDKAKNIANEVGNLHKAIDAFVTQEETVNSVELQKLTKMAQELDAYWEKKPLSTNDFSSLAATYNNSKNLPAGFQHVLNSTIANYFASLGCSIKQNSDQFKAVIKSFYGNVLRDAVTKSNLPNNEVKPSDFKTIIESKLEALTAELCQGLLQSRFKDYAQVTGILMTGSLKNIISSMNDVSEALKNLPTTKKFDEFLALVSKKLSERYENSKTFNTKWSQYMDTVCEDLAQKSGISIEEVKEAIKENSAYTSTLRKAKLSVITDISEGKLKPEDIDRAVEEKSKKLVDTLKTSTDFINELKLSSSAKKYLCLEHLYRERRVHGIKKNIISIIDQHTSFVDKLDKWQSFFNQINQAKSADQMKAILIENQSLFYEIEDTVQKHKDIVDFKVNGGEFGGEELNILRETVALKLISSNVSLPNSETLAMLYEAVRGIMTEKNDYMYALHSFSQLYDNAFLNGPFKD